MSKNIAEAQPRAPFSKPLALILATEAILTVGLTAHDVQQSFAERSASQVEAAPTPSPTPYKKLSYKELREKVPEGPCADASHDGGDDVSETEAAAACVRAQAKGKIALVDYRESKGVDTQQLANSITSTLLTLSGGLIQTTIVAKEATPQEKAAFSAAKGFEDCVNPKDMNTWGSVIADLHGTEEADFVLAISDSAACIPGVVGVTDRGTSRHAEVMAGSFLEPTLDDLTTTAAHEVLHDYGLGHDGTYSKDKKSIRGHLGVGTTFDLKQYLQGGEYSAYGDCARGEVMGAACGAPIEALDLNQVQLEQLREPAQLLEDKLTSNIVPLTNKSHSMSHSINREAAARGKQLGIDLPEKVKLDDESGYVFDSLVLVPIADETHHLIHGVEFVLLDDNKNSTVSLGTVNLGKLSEDLTMQYGDKKFNLKLTGDTLTARLMS